MTTTGPRETIVTEPTLLDGQTIVDISEDATHTCAVTDVASSTATVGTIRRSMKLSWFSDRVFDRSRDCAFSGGDYRGARVDGTGLRALVDCRALLSCRVLFVSSSLVCGRRPL